MEVPGGQRSGTAAHACHMRLPAPPSQNAMPVQEMPEHWQSGSHPDQLLGPRWAGASICTGSQPHSWPRLHCWGLPSAPWRQEVPSTMPWAGRRPGMVSFTGVPPCSTSLDSTRPAAAACKRRLEEGEEEHTHKQFLTEDMMADHFNCLSLENDHAYGTSGFLPRGHPVGKWHQWVTNYTRFQEVEGRLHPDQLRLARDGKPGEEEVFVEGEYTMGDTPVLTVSPELQESLRDASAGSILPEKVLHSMNHPCMELVLWRPPGNLIHEAIRSLTRQRDPSWDRDGCNGLTAQQSGAGRSLFVPRLSPDNGGTSPRRGVLQDSEDAMEL